MLQLQAKWSRKASSPRSRMFRPAGLAVHPGGKIKPDAPFGSGRNAKINVAVATRQLRDAHGVDQLTGDGVGTRLDLPLRVPSPAAPAREPAPAPSGDPLADAIKQERLGQRANRREPGRRRRGRARTSTRPRPTGKWA